MSGNTRRGSMRNTPDRMFDDGQPLVEFAPLKPAEVVILRTSQLLDGRGESDWRYVPVRRFG